MEPSTSIDYTKDDTGGSDFDLYAGEEKPSDGSLCEEEEDTISSTSTEDEFCLPVVSPLKDFSRSLLKAVPRLFNIEVGFRKKPPKVEQAGSSREVSDSEKDHAKSPFKKDSFRSITDLLSSPGDTSRDEGIRYSNIEHREWGFQLSGESSGLSDDSDSSSDDSDTGRDADRSDTGRDADRSDFEAVGMGSTVCPHEERRSSERRFPVHGSYRDESTYKSHRKVKRKHSKRSMTRIEASPEVEEAIQGDDNVVDPTFEKSVKTFTDLFESSEPVTSNRGADMGAWGWKMSHTDDSHRTAPLYNRSEEDNSLFPESGECSKRMSLDHVSGKIDTKYLTKTISSIKKKIKRFDKNFEDKFGYKPTQADKMKNRDVRPLMSELNKLRKELKKMREDFSDRLQAKSFHFDDSLPGPSSEMKEAVHTLRRMESMLREQRLGAKRPSDLVEMTSDEMLDEKTELQRALLYYEYMHGRPKTKEDRNFARPLYDRYREVKRTIVRSSSKKDNIIELAPILENEAMDFTLASPQHRGSLQDEDEAKDDEISVENLPINEDPHPGMMPRLLESPRKSINLEDLHALPTFELKNRKKLAKEDRKLLRKSLKDYEEKFERENGRKVQKDDRGPMEETYKEYRHAKAKVKLLEALLTKHEPPRI